MNVWNDIAALERFARFAPYTFIVLGAIVAFAGQWVKSTLESRVADLKGEAAILLKHTAPKMDPYLHGSVLIGDLLVTIDTENLVPFRARWTIVTENDVVVAGFMLQDQEIYPTEERKRFNTKVYIDADKVKNEYLKLYFRYESVYSAELGNLPELQGNLAREYRFRGGNVSAW